MLMKLNAVLICNLALGGAAIAPSFAQSGGTLLAFEVASVKPNNSDAPAHSNFRRCMESTNGAFLRTRVQHSYRANS